MSKHGEEGFVADGAGRLYDASREKIAAIEQRIRASYAEALENAGRFDRLKLEARIRKEVKAEVDKIVPPDAHY
jgi:hypothetical protein